MRWLKKLFGKEQSHEDWLEAHPGKGSNKSAPPSVSAEDEAATRGRMEAELDRQREKRDA